MFRKLISNLSYSPSLIGQLGLYAKRIRNEEIARRIGLVFIALALVVQSVAVFQPPEAANASSGNDFVYGGLGNVTPGSINNFLKAYDANIGHLKDILNYAGITRPDIEATHLTRRMPSSVWEWSRNQQLSYQQGGRTIPIFNRTASSVVTVYATPLQVSNRDKNAIGWAGRSARLGWFEVLQSSGNLLTTSLPTSSTTYTSLAPSCQKIHSLGSSVANVTTETILSVANCTSAASVVNATSCPLQPSLSIDSSHCQSCENDPTVWAGSVRCTSPVYHTDAAFNLDQNVDATTTAANGNDRIRYTVTAQNVGHKATMDSVSVNLHDSLEYAHLLDAGGGAYDNVAQVLSWDNILLQPGQSIDRTYVIQVDDKIPATARGISDTTSFDCKMTNIFGTATTVAVSCPFYKNVENALSVLPVIDPTVNTITMVIACVAAIYLYMRARQIKKEVRLVRRDLNAGII